jgi:DNA-binding GntR family transcriptional regulator
MTTDGRLVPITDHQSLQERTYRALRDALLDGKFAIGERIFEAEIAQTLGVSRVPVREAVRRLQQDGLLEVRPRSGIYVAAVSVEEADDVYRIRAALEGTAARLAAERITPAELRDLRDMLKRERESGRAGKHGSQAQVVVRADEFHRAVHVYARSPRLYELLELIYAQVMHFRAITLSLPGRADAALHGHQHLYEALSRHDGPEAERIMREHIDSARRLLLDRLQDKAEGRT